MPQRNSQMDDRSAPRMPRRLRITEPAQLRQRHRVFRSPGELLGDDHVVEAGDFDLDPEEPEDLGPRRQLAVVDRKAFGVGDAHHRVHPSVLVAQFMISRSASTSGVMASPAHAGPVMERASTERNASHNRDRFVSSHAGTTSRSMVGRDDPCTNPAYPPTNT